MPKPLSATIDPTPDIHFLDDGQGAFRVWRNTYFSDQFEVLPAAEFNRFRKAATLLGFPFIDHTNDD